MLETDGDGMSFKIETSGQICFHLIFRRLLHCTNLIFVHSSDDKIYLNILTNQNHRIDVRPEGSGHEDR